MAQVAFPQHNAFPQHIMGEGYDDVKMKDTTGNQVFKLKEENILSNVVSFLTLPLQLESASDADPDTSGFFAACPWCSSISEHVFVGKGFLRKDEYRCMSCAQRTSKCLKFSICRNGSKSTLLWDDQFCDSCDRDVQRLGAGEISLGTFLDNFRGTENYQNNHDHCASSENTANVSTSLKATAGTGVNVAPMSTTRRNSLGKFKEEVIEDEYLLDDADEESDDNMYQNQPEERFAVSTSESDSDLQEIGPWEPWMAVRDAVLFWPGPERADVERYRELCSHKSWIRRWIVSCQGDEVWAIKRILAHLKWRQEYQLDTIMDEDWSAMDARGEMYVSGVDKAGCPTWTWRAHLHDASLSTPEMGARFLICMMERTWAVNPMAERVSVICDCSNLAFGNYEHKMFLICLDILSEHYPDNLKMTFMFPVSWALCTIVSLGKNFLDPQTRDKIQAFRREELDAVFARHFDRDQVEQRLGGTLSLDAARRRRMLEEDPAAMRAWRAEAATARRRGGPPHPAAAELVRRALPAELQHLVADGLACDCPPPQERLPSPPPAPGIRLVPSAAGGNALPPPAEGAAAESPPAADGVACGVCETAVAREEALGRCEGRGVAGDVSGSEASRIRVALSQSNGKTHTHYSPAGKAPAAVGVRRRLLAAAAAVAAVSLGATLLASSGPSSLPSHV